MNGQTGKIVSSLPQDNEKVANSLRGSVARYQKDKEKATTLGILIVLLFYSAFMHESFEKSGIPLGDNVIIDGELFLALWLIILIIGIIALIVNLGNASGANEDTFISKEKEKINRALSNVDNTYRNSTRIIKNEKAEIVIDDNISNNITKQSKVYMDGQELD